MGAGSQYRIILRVAILKVARMGHPVLRTPARTLEQSEIRSPAIQTLIDDMLETMQEYQGLGLAAPQVHHDLRLFVAGFDRDDESFPPSVVINPEITPIGTTVVDAWEGCLSIPDIRGRVPRHYEVRVRAFDRKGKLFELNARGLASRVVQHENDHLSGVLFLDRMKSLETLTFLDEYTRFCKREETEPE